MFRIKSDNNSSVAELASALQPKQDQSVAEYMEILDGFLTRTNGIKFVDTALTFDEITGLLELRDQCRRLYTELETLQNGVNGLLNVL